MERRECAASHARRTAAHACQVRAEFDDILLNHAAHCGATVVQETKVTDILFEGARPVAAKWKAQTGSKGEGLIKFDYLIDASGRNGLMSVKYLKNRSFSQSLKNTAAWGYWTGTDSYMPGTTRDNAVWIEALEGTVIRPLKGRHSIEHPC